MRTAALVVCAVLLTGCGSATGEPAGGTGNGVPPMYGAACPDVSDDRGLDEAPDASSLPRLGDDVVAAGVLRCSIDVRDITGEGRWSVLVASWAASGVDAVTAALRAPDQPGTDGMCGMVYVPTPWFVLVTDDGAVLRVRVPWDACGHPQQAFLDALAGLPFTTVGETRLEQVETAEAQTSGCSQEWKDMVAIVAADPGPARRARRPVLPGPQPSMLRVCVYRSDGTAPEQTPGGEFVSWRILEGHVLVRALAGIESAPAAAATCTERATVFAVLTPAGGDAALTVEVDGCHRMLTAAYELRAAPAALVRALE